ncbi:RdgB/HAM1 family non-canonical purine NTP pyrophosphatase [Oceanivirga miroungae]|uniref:dITP/XTP pyrophosphatase n=1 Tax=Oceanivirga miroungae TaxID=1130046 RepID=A0A6I8MBQ7_9FUSO|nr:RdgB/HAM1 family non-canonical purine NTP pyrophosphatase [Oceanivirga miroungae]VWL84915.1 RdgB/HAM1 family non-canonical purine NTP pyrophosphatase [Oceanivirga miroungae]
MKKIILATTNKGKLAEFNELVKGLGVEFILPVMPEIEEDGLTFSENALKKASVVAKLNNMTTLSDDSGLCVEALDNGPGIYTARYKSELGSYENRQKALIEELNSKNKENRKAKFVCVLCLCEPNGEYMTFEGIVEGEITEKIEGTNGHGYDPIFYNKEIGKSFGNATEKEKNTVSHRAKAFEKFKKYLKTEMGINE